MGKGGGGERNRALYNSDHERPRKYDFQNLSGRFNFKRKKAAAKELIYPRYLGPNANPRWEWMEGHPP